MCCPLGERVIDMQRGINSWKGSPVETGVLGPWRDTWQASMRMHLFPWESLSQVGVYYQNNQPADGRSCCTRLSGGVTAGTQEEAECGGFGGQQVSLQGCELLTRSHQKICIDIDCSDHIIIKPLLGFLVTKNMWNTFSFYLLIVFLCEIVENYKKVVLNLAKICNTWASRSSN